MTQHFVKLSANILTSSVWAEDSDTLRVWIYLLASADAQGVVRATVPGVAVQCGLAVSRVREILDRFAPPDPESRTADNEGRRIAITRAPQFEIRLLNYHRYRDFDYTHAERQRRYRSKKCDASLPSRDASLPSRVTQVEVEVDVEKTKTPSTASRLTRARAAASYSEAFSRFWSAYPRHQAKADAAKAFDQVKAGEILETILHAVEAAKGSEAWRRDGGQFVPFAATWLRGRRWEDELAPTTGSSAENPPREPTPTEVLIREQLEHEGDPRWREYRSLVVAHRLEAGSWARWVAGEVSPTEAPR